MPRKAKPTPQPARHALALGNGATLGNLPGDGIFTLPHIQQFSSILGAGNKVYWNLDEATKHSRQNARNMRRDPVIMAALRARQLASCELPWHIEPEDRKDSHQQQVCTALTRDVEGVPGFLNFKLALLEAIWWGKSGVQNRFGWEYTPTGRRIRVVDWQPLHGDSLVRSWDTGGWGVYVGNPGGLGSGTLNVEVKPADIQRAHFFDEPVSPHWLKGSERETLVIHQHERAAGEFFEPEIGANAINGVGLRTFAYWTWYQKQELQGILLNFIERVGLGVNIWYYQLGNSTSENNMRAAAESQSENMFLLIPRSSDGKHGEGFERIEANSAGVDSIMKVVQEIYNPQLKELILGQTATSEPTTSGMNSNLAEVHENTFWRLVKWDATNLGETLTRDLLGVFLRWNYPDENFRPKFVIDVERPNPKEWMEAAKIAWEMGADIDEDELRQVCGLSRPDANSKVLRKPPDAQPPQMNEAMPGGANTTTPAFGNKVKRVG